MNIFSSPYAFIFAWLLCSIILFNTAMCNFSIRCNEKDEQALLNFKKGVIDPSGVLSSWSIELDCCQWKGVKCDNFTTRVTHLSLPCSTTPPVYIDKDEAHCLTGSIYLSLLLAELEFLNYLDLNNNDFLSIQFDSVHSKNCHNLSIDTPPLHCVNSTTTLRYLDLSYNENLVINSLQWLSRISSLEYLDLSGIDLHKKINWLQSVTMLPSLSVLTMDGCQLRDLSPSLEYANFTALKYLNLSQNEFYSELPKWLFNLSSDITHIAFSSSSLRGQIPKALLNLRHLEVLDLVENNMDGPIPDWLGELEHLRFLDLGLNMFTGSIPTNLGNLSSLIGLLVGQDQLTGVVSGRNFEKLSKLKMLSIYSSLPLIFDFDFHWVPPFQLEVLALTFAGPSFPAWIYTQRDIIYLVIIKSSFEAGNKFWNFVSRVTCLYLIYNWIDGNMSNVLLNSTFILLSSNDLKGGLPRLSSNVVFLEISNNSLSGIISPLLCLCDDDKIWNGKNRLKFLDISHNHLSGELTNCWKNWKSLVHLNLGGNNLKGKIPPSMGLLSNLTSLHLHENKLYGEIPLSLRNCHSLLVFNVRGNNLSGNIPTWIPHAAMVLQIRSNNFSGNIPTQICQMSSLIILDIADNKISGHIPTCIHNITALVFNNASMNRLTFISLIYGAYYYSEDRLELVTKGQELEYGKNLHFMGLIDMSSNNLSGTIPPQMFRLTGLESLNLSYNKLMGKIPDVIGKMKHLESLDFSSNQLSGEIPESLSSLSFLSYLNLSFNNFLGKVPSGTQLEGFDVFSYVGNPDLCGPPLPNICLQDGKSKYTEPIDEDEDDYQFMSWFYIGIESGFITSFLGVCCVLFLDRKWRHAYFKFLYDLRDRIYAMLAIKMNSFH